MQHALNLTSCTKILFFCSAKDVCTSLYFCLFSVCFSVLLLLFIIFIILGLYLSVADVNFSSQYLSGFSYVHTAKRLQASLHDGYSGNARCFFIVMHTRLYKACWKRKNDINPSVGERD